MNTRILEYVIAVAEEKQQARAADRLMVTQPALSQQIRKLETELGTPLFRKEKNELVLTDAGKIYMNSARSALAIYNNALSDIQKIRTRKQKQISLVYNNAILTNIPEILSEFIDTHRDIYVSTILGNASAAKEYLSNGFADIAIMATKELTNSLLDFIPLKDAELQLALPFDHPLVRDFRRNGVNFDKLKNEFFILNQSGSFVYQYSRELFAKNQFIPKAFCEISESRAIRSMIMNHKGVGFLPDNLYEEGLYASFSMDPPAVFHIAIAIHKSTLITPAIRDLIMLLLRKYDPYSQD